MEIAKGGSSYDCIDTGSSATTGGGVRRPIEEDDEKLEPKDARESTDKRAMSSKPDVEGSKSSS